MKSSSRSSSTLRKSPHPTAALLLETTATLLETESVGTLSLAMVLESSGVSHGSLYHHYADFLDLVEQAIAYRYVRRLEGAQVAYHSLLEATSAADLRQRAEALFAQFLAPERRPNRMEQVEALGSIRGRPRLAEYLASAQKVISEERSAIFAELQQRGWIRTDLDPTALSDFSQGMMMGRVIEDVSSDSPDSKAWNDVATAAFRAIFFGE